MFHEINDRIYSITKSPQISYYHFQYMDKKGLPDPRFTEFTEVFNGEGTLIGFSIPNSDFIFKYDSHGGWYDEERRYYNADGVLQSDDEEDIEDLESDNEDLSENDDQLIDQFEDLLRKEEEGYVRKEAKEIKKVEESSPAKAEQQLHLKAFQDLLAQYLKKQRLKDNLSAELFIYFKQKAKYFQSIKPQAQAFQSIQERNKHVQSKTKVAVISKRQSLISADKWLGEPQVFLDFSGQSEKTNEYDRYWYGHVKTTAERYLHFLRQIKQSQVFYLLENKTYFALKSKFYHKKSQEQIKNTIKDFTAKIEALTDKQSIVIRIENLPQFFPLSLVYDLVEYVDGNLTQIQQAVIIDNQTAQLTATKSTALKVINLEAYSHDKGQFLEVSLKQTLPRQVENPEKRFYSVSIESEFKTHERQLNDTLALVSSRSQIARICTVDVEAKSGIRFVLGSIPTLKKVLMFRGQSLNVVKIKSQLPPQK